MRSSYTPKHGIPVTWGLTGVGFPLMICIRPRELRGVFSYSCRTKAAIIPKVGRLVDMAATNGKRDTSRVSQSLCALHRLGGSQREDPQKLVHIVSKYRFQICLDPRLSKGRSQKFPLRKICPQTVDASSRAQGQRRWYSRIK